MESRKGWRLLEKNPVGTQGFAFGCSATDDAFTRVGDYVMPTMYFARLIGHEETWKYTNGSG